MPRQPYLPAFKNVRYSVGALSLKERPDLLAKIGMCLAIWGYVDNEMGNLFSILLGTDSEPALAVFLTLRRSANQIEALKHAATFRLSDPELEVFNALVSGYGSLEAERNALAHGCFGTCPDDPDILFWIDIKDHVHFQVEVLSQESKGVISDDRHRRLQENLYVYRLPDLCRIYEEMEAIWWAAFYMNGYLRKPGNEFRAEAFSQLQAMPAIKTRLNSKSIKK